MSAVQPASQAHLDDDALLSRATEALAHYFGHDAFREPQRPAISAILRNENVLVVMPTGAGKSLLYQLPAFVRKGLTLVVSPLIALMKDQVDGLHARGLPAAYLNSTQTHAEQDEIIERAAAGEIRLLYVSPERFRSWRFQDRLQGTPIRCFAVDEAHCISQWGHDFRPDYARLGEAIKRFQPKQVLALTATATPDVRDDIATQMGLPLRTIVSGFARENLDFEVRGVRRRAEKMSVVADTMDWMLRAGGGSMILYASTRKSVESVARDLISGPARERGLRVAIYHGGMDDGARRLSQESFKRGEAPIIVATNAFGMGVDKPDIRAVIHIDLPGTLEAYYQEAGRAGRDGKLARCILCYMPSDLRIQEFFLAGENPSRDQILAIWNALLAGPDVVEETRASLAERAGGQSARTRKQVRRGKGEWDADSETSEMSVTTALRHLERADYVRRLFNHQPLAFFSIPLHDGDTDDKQRARWTKLAPSQRALMQALEVKGARDGLSLPINAALSLVEFTPATVQSAIRALVEAGELAYQPPFRGRAIQVLKRVPAESLELDWGMLVRKATHARDRLNQIVKYAESSRCRHRALIEYFGETVDKDCGTRCDACRSRGLLGTAAGGPSPTSHAPGAGPLPDDAIDAVFEILMLAQTLGGRFGRRVLGQVLTGSKSQRITEWKLPRNPAYGKLAHLPVDRVNAAVDALVKAELLETYKPNESSYRLCRLSETGRRVVQQRDASALPAAPELRALGRRSTAGSTGARQSQHNSRGGTGVSPVSAQDDQPADLGFRPPDLRRIAHRQGAYLPHWFSDSAVYSVTFRLTDSLPREALDVLRAEPERIRSIERMRGAILTEIEREELQAELQQRIEAALDRGVGNCWLAQPEVANVVAASLQHFDEDRYDLVAWCVMPNHVHAVVAPRPGHELPAIVHSWKSYTAKKANGVLGRTGAFWQAEYFDRIVRSEDDLARQVEYVLGNPSTAGLRQWRWMGSRFVDQAVFSSTHGQDARAPAQVPTPTDRLDAMPTPASPADVADRLRELRKVLAGSMPAYRVMSNRTLDAIAERQPQDERELLDVPGVGPTTIARYGHDILRAIADAAPAEVEPATESVAADEPAATADTPTPHAIDDDPQQSMPVPPTDDSPIEAQPPPAWIDDDPGDDRPPDDFLESLEPPPADDASVAFDDMDMAPPPPARADATRAVVGSPTRPAPSPATPPNRGMPPDVPADANLARTFLLAWLGLDADAIATARGLERLTVIAHLAKLQADGYEA